MKKKKIKKNKKEKEKEKRIRKERTERNGLSKYTVDLVFTVTGK